MLLTSKTARGVMLVPSGEAIGSSMRCPFNCVPALMAGTTPAMTVTAGFIQGGLATGGFLLLLRPDMGIGLLGERFLPESAAAAYAGLALTVFGAALAVWARVFLGANWSATVTIKEDHVSAPNIETIVSLSKRRGFVYPSSEIYGGLGSAWDYGPLGVELKRNVKEA